jgi:hypothetical protein
MTARWWGGHTVRSPVTGKNAIVTRTRMSVNIGTAAAVRGLGEASQRQRRSRIQER